MIRPTRALLLLSLAASLACRREPEPALVATTGPVTLIGFEATNPAGHRALLLGTMHIGVERDDFPAWVTTRLQAAPGFAMETDPGEVMGLAALMMRSDGTTLEQELGPDYWAKLERKVGKEMAAQLRLLKPSAAGAAIESMGLPPTQPLDLVLHDEAFNAGKQMTYLEKPEVQLRALDQVMNIGALRRMLDQPDDGDADIQALLAAYRAGDVAVLERLADDERKASLAAGVSAAEVARDDATMIGDRNRSWVPVIEGMVASGDAFIAVGALHLCGPDAVQRLLAAKGFSVRRVTGP